MSECTHTPTPAHTLILLKEQLLSVCVVPLSLQLLFIVVVSLCHLTPIYCL